jgi:hypothetical protein
MASGFSIFAMTGVPAPGAGQPARAPLSGAQATNG